jgi:hypothetical protein
VPLLVFILIVLALWFALCVLVLREVRFMNQQGQAEHLDKFAQVVTAMRFWRRS